MRMKRLQAALSALLFSTAAMSGAAQAERLRFAIGFPPENPHFPSAKSYADMVKEQSNGDLSIRVYSLELLNLAEMSDGLKGGLTDIGTVLTPYFPAQYPNTNMATELSMLLALNERSHGKEGYAYSGAMQEYVLLNCPDCNAEFEKQNQVYTSAGSSPQYGLLCTKPVISVSDLKGKRMRAGGAQWARWAQHFDASSVSLPGNEIFEALNQGVVDCTVQAATELTGLGLMDAIKHITMTVPGGVFGGTAVSNVNRDVWKRLNEDQRRALLRSAAVMGAETSYHYDEHARRNLKAAAEKGIKIHEADAELIAASRKFIETDIEKIATYYETQHGVKNASEKIEILRTLIEKWLSLTAGIDTSEELANLYWTEVGSKVDVSKHGL